MYNKMLKKDLVQKCQALEAELAILKSKLETLEKQKGVQNHPRVSYNTDAFKNAPEGSTKWAWGIFYRTKNEFPHLTVKMNRDIPTQPIPMYLSGSVWIPCFNLFLEGSQNG